MVFRKMREQMKIVIWIVSVAFVMSLLYVGGVSLFGGGGGGGTVAAQAVAKVNGEAIPYNDFYSVYTSRLRQLQQYQNRISGSANEGIMYGVLQSLIDNALMLQIAKDQRIRVDNSEIDKQIQQIKDQVGGADNLKQILDQQGLTERKLRDLIEQDLMVNSLREQQSTVNVTEDEVKQAYEQVRISHILIQPENTDDEASWKAAETKAKDLLKQIRNGADFAELAKANSADTGSKEKGGDLGFVGRDVNFVEPFKKAAFSLGVGEISDPVKTTYGYHIIKVTDEKKAEGDEFEKQRPDLEKQIRTQKGQEKLQQWLDSKREAAEIEILDPQMKAHQDLVNEQYEEALASYDAAIKENPNDPYLHVSLAGVYQKMDRKDDAIAQLEKAVEVDDSQSDIYLALGAAYRGSDKTDKAVEAFKKASDLDPYDFQLHYTLASLFSQMGKEDLAKAEQDKLTEIAKQMDEQRKAQEAQQQKLQEAQQGAAGSGAADQSTDANTGSNDNGQNR